MKPHPSRLSAPPMSARVDQTGTDGDDQMIGTVVGDIIEARDGSDLIAGFLGSDTLYGDRDGRKLWDGDIVPDFGNDLLIGGRGSDSAIGDAGTLRLNLTGGGNLTVETGDDAIASWIGAAPSVVDRNYGDVEELYVTVEGDLGGNLQVFAGNDAVVGGPADDSFGDAYVIDVKHNGLGGEAFLSLGDDRLIGGAQLVGDSVYLDISGSGSAAVTVQGGDDRLIGGRDGAALIGDFRYIDLATPDGQSATVICGDDTLIGSAADDYLAGDHDYAVEGGVNFVKGADTFVFFGTFGDDEILDFDTGLDTLIFVGFSGATLDDIVQSHDTAADALLLDFTGIGGGTVTLHGVSQIAGDDIQFA